MHVLGNRAQGLFIAACIALGILSLGGCGGGGGVTNPLLPQRQAAPASGTLSLVLTGSAQSARLPGVAGFSESISLPANNAIAGTTLSLTVSSQVPSGMPALAASMFVAQPFLYLTLSSNKTVTLNGYPGFAMTLPPGVHPTSLPVKIGFYDPTTGWKHIGDMTLSGSTATFTPASGAHITLNANVNYYAITYTCSSSTLPLAGPGKPMPIPRVGGIDGKFIVPANNAAEGTTVTLTSFDVKPPRAPLPQVAHRSGVDLATLSGSTVLFWVSTTYSSSFTFAAFPVTQWDLAEGTNTTGVTFYLETFDGPTLLDTETASSVSGLTVNFPGTAATLAIATGHTYWWELISVASLPPGAVTEFPIPTTSEFPSYITSAGGDLWFTENQSNKIGRITTAGVITEFSAGTATGPYDIITGPDGRPWFGALTAQGLGRIASNGSVTFVPIPTVDAHPEQLVSDSPHNSIWFAEVKGHKIGVYSLTTRSITEYPVPPVGRLKTRPAGIALDKSGNVWFSDQAGDQVDEMSNTGTLLKRLPLPGSTGPFSLGVWYMTLGDDGNLWLLETSGGPTFKGAIARIDPLTSAITTFVPPGPDPVAVGLVARPGGIWLPVGGSQLVRTSYTGAFKEWVIPGSLGYGIVEGPDNNMWFVDQSKNAITRVKVNLLP